MKKYQKKNVLQVSSGRISQKRNHSSGNNYDSLTLFMGKELGSLEVRPTGDAADPLGVVLSKWDGTTFKNTPIAQNTATFQLMAGMWSAAHGQVAAALHASLESMAQGTKWDDSEAVAPSEEDSTPSRVESTVAAAASEAKPKKAKV